MSRVLIKSLWSVNPYLDSTAFVQFTFIFASSIATNNNHSLKIGKSFYNKNINYYYLNNNLNKTYIFSAPSTMSWYSRFILNLQLFTHKYLLPSSYWWSRFFRAFFNSQMRLAIYLTENLPFLAFWNYGIKHSYVDIYKYRVNIRT